MKGFKDFRNEEDINKFGIFQTLTDTLSDDEMEEIYSYTGSWYKAMNHHLILKKEDDEMNREIDIFDRALSKCIIDKNIVVFRGSSKTWVDLMFNKYNIPNKPYWSTSLLKKTALHYALQHNYGYLIKIYIRKGSYGLYYPSIADDNLHENEVILPRTTKFRLLRKKLFGHYIEVETIL